MDLRPIEALLEGALNNGTINSWFMGGSAVILAGTDYVPNDYDFCVQLDDLDDPSLFFYDWETPELEDDYETDHTFRTYRAGDINILAFVSKREYNVVSLCTMLATEVQMRSKEDRYKLFSEMRARVKDKG